MANNDTSKAANASSPAANSPESPSQSPPPKESSPPPQGPPPSSSPPPSSPPPSSPPPSSPPPSSPTPSSPPPSSPPPSSPPPSSPPPSSTSPPPSDTSSPPPSPPQDSSSSPPPPDATPSNPAPPATPTTPPSNSSAGIIPPPPSPSSGQFKPPPPVATPKSPVVTLSPPPSVPAGNASSKPGSTGSGDLPSSSSSHSTSSSLGSASNRDLLIVGVVASSIILIALLGACVVCLISKKKRRKEANDNIPYTWKNNGAASAKGGSYRHNAPAYNNNLKIPPPPGGWGQNQQQQPNVPPQMIGSSGEMASSYSTGQASSASEPPSPSLQIGFNKSMFTYEELSVATNGFAPSNILGQGGFGLVHKGILPNGKEIAVKSLKAGSGQGEREFQAEVEIISRVHHRHLVSLVGYSIAGAQRMLVYEYVPNNNLEYHLHKRGDPPLDFSTRLRIALGSAKGLAYLHEDCHPRIIHRDIKASNILIDFSFEAKVADFGLAKLTTDANTHVSTRVMGTFGYLAPEYAASGKLTEKSDVFSFGVMLLELVTGRRPVDPKMKYMEDSLVDWARPLLSKALEDGNYNEIADPCLERNYNPQEMSRMVASAAACIRHSAKKRPKMSQIVRALEGDVSLDDLNDGVRPGHRSTSSLTAGSSDYDTKQYNADLKRFRQMALETGEFASGGGTTSEYGLNPSSSSDSSRDSSRKF